MNSLIFERERIVSAKEKLRASMSDILKRHEIGVADQKSKAQESSRSESYGRKCKEMKEELKGNEECSSRPKKKNICKSGRLRLAGK